MSDLRKRAEEIVDKKIKFQRNLYSYIVVNAVLVVINFLFSPDFWWVLFPIVFWGIGILVDFLKAYVFTAQISEDERERKIQKEMEKLRK